MLQASKATFQEQLADEVRHHGQTRHQLERVDADLQLHKQQAEDWQAQHHAVQEQLHEAQSTATAAAQVFHCLPPCSFL